MQTSCFGPGHPAIVFGDQQDDRGGETGKIGEVETGFGARRTAMQKGMPTCRHVLQSMVDYPRISLSLP